MNRSTKITIFLFSLIFTSLACRANTDWLTNNSLPNSDAVATETVIELLPTSNPATFPPPLTSIESSLMSVYELTYPSVVSIMVLDEDGNGGSGSGFVIDMDGHIVTNLHVVQNAVEVQVSFPSGLKARGEVIGTDKDSDLAIIAVDVDQKYLFPIKLGDSDQLQVGQIVVAIGSPFGLEGTMTYGIISNIGRTMNNSLNTSPNGSTYSAGDIIQTDAAINPGNSGGPLINLAGEVVGINRAIQTFNTNSENEPVNSGIGFAISVNILNTVSNDLIEFGKYDYPLLGISSLGGDMPLAIAEELGLELAIGVLVTNVSDGGPAEDAGVLAGDVINQIDDVEVRDFGDLLSYLFIHTSPGDSVNINVFREGENIVIPLIIGVRP
jgi:S1-C subfamily serine protease